MGQRLWRSMPPGTGYYMNTCHIWGSNTPAENGDQQLE